MLVSIRKNCCKDWIGRVNYWFSIVERFGKHAEKITSELVTGEFSLFQYCTVCSAMWSFGSCYSKQISSKAQAQRAYFWVYLRSAQSPSSTRAFFFFIFKKIKISKIYVCFEIFQNYPRRPLGGDRPKMQFFSSNLQRGPWPKKCKGACRPANACRPPGAIGSSLPI